ncbi:hypothetical protein M0Q97_02690 [Candidatus Dojkabacteria bacterium]|jgi:hypothetical protein|nr:hypothetical protein [Candidatus Dojkabacteria bacterium]
MKKCNIKMFNEYFTPLEHFLNLSIKEGLTLSVSYVFFLDKLKNILLKYIDEEYFFIENHKDEYIYLNLILDISKKNATVLSKEIISFLNNSGYFISQSINDFGSKINIQNLTQYKGKEIHIYFNKVFDVPEETPNIIYHATLFDLYENKIKKMGLIPKTQKMVSNDLERLYFINNISDAEYFIHLKYSTLKNKIKNKQYNIDIKKWVILGIDIKSIGKFKLYKDTKMNNSYYTYDTISPYSIRIEKIIDI